MRVILSADRHCSTYHVSGCPYAKRIAISNRMTVNEKNVAKYKYHPCKYCSGLQGFVRVAHTMLDHKKQAQNLDYTYEKETDTLYLRTKAGFWKVYEKENAGYLLYHLNVFRDELTTQELMNGTYHRQTDVGATDSVGKLISYIEAHDRAKQIIAIDYRKLPRRTEKQKQYYKAAERKDRRRQMDRLDRLFDMLEKTGNCRASELYC